MKEELIKEYLTWRKQLKPREWHEVEQQIRAQYKKKADQLELDDSDIEEISNRLKTKKHEFINKAVDKSINKKKGEK